MFTVTAFVFLICTAALLSTTEGRPHISMRCRCIQKALHSNPPIRIGRIVSLNAIPAGPRCQYEEIIATMKKGIMCLNPSVNWVISLKKQWINKRNVAKSN